jgi:hypothetical protein
MPNDTSPSNSYGSVQSRDENTTAPDKETIAADAGALKDEARRVTDKVVNEASDNLGKLAEQAKAQVAETTDKVKGIAEEQKELFAAQVGGVADAMMRVADDLEADNGASARYARMIADGAEKLSDTVRSNDVEQLMNIAQDFGRKQPAAFLGAAALLGFAASRFLLASAKRAEEQNATTEASSYVPAGESGLTNGAGAYDAGRV